MSTTPSATAAGKTTCRASRTVAWIALASLAVGFQVAAQTQKAAQEQIPAVLKLREFDFSYRGTAAYLSCHALQGRIASILVALGARDDVEVRLNGCDDVGAPGEPTDTWRMPSDRWQTSSDRWGGAFNRLGNRGAGSGQSAHVRVRAMMPIEVTPAVLAEMGKDKSRRELVSRVTGNPAASLNDPIVFPAQRRLVILSRRTIDLAPEECELLEQMSSSVFPKLGMRVVGGRPACDRGEVSHIPPKVTVEALMPVMPETPQVKPAGESDPHPGAPAKAETKSSEGAAAVPNPE